MKKRILSGLLALALVCTLLPVTARAAYTGKTYNQNTTLTYDWYETCEIIGSSDPDNPVVITINNTNGGTNLQNSLSVSGANSDQMAGGFTIVSGYAKITGGDVVATIYRVKNGGWNYQGPMLTVNAGATLTLENVNVHGTNQEGKVVTAKCAAIRNFGTLIMEKGAKIDYCTGNYADEPGGGIYNKGALMMNGGSIHNCTATTGTKANAGGGIYNDGGSIEINGGQIDYSCQASNGGGIYMNGGSLVLNSGAVMGKPLTTGGYGALETANNASLILNGGFILGAISSTPENALTGSLPNSGGGSQAPYFVDGGSVHYALPTILSKNETLTVHEDAVVTFRLDDDSPLYTGVHDAETQTWKIWVFPTGVTMSESSKTLDYPHNDSFTLTATLVVHAQAPEDYIKKDLTWESSNESVATVDDGTVTLQGTGSATITATTFNGMSASCALTVTASHVHNYTTASNESGHWTECSCGQTTAVEAHTPATDAAVAATCTTTGLTEGSHCSVCGAVISAQTVVNALGHDHKAVMTAPTCTAQGYTTHTCSRCNDSYVDAYVSATGHTVVTDEAVAATCTATGLTEGSHCSVCKEVLVAQEEIPANGHTAVTDAAVAPTCTATGKTEGSHCSVCSEVIVAQTTVTATGHTVVADATVPATCTTTGLTAGSHCSVCKAVIVAQETVPATGHTIVTDPAVAATCTATGLTAGSHCSVCKAVIVAQETVPATGHSYIAKYDASDHWTECSCGDKTAVVNHSFTWVVDKPATEDETGLQHEKCTGCAYTRNLNTEIPKLAHTHSMTHHTAVAASCTTNGSVEYWHCSKCGKNYSNETGTNELSSIVIPAGHSYGSWVSAVPATCEATGTVGHYTCSVCHKNFDTNKAELSSLTIVALEHDWGEWVVTTPAACTAAGVETRTCSRDSSHTEAQPIAALGHNMTKHEAKAATTEADGNIAYWHCSRCEKYFRDAAGNNEIAWAATIVYYIGYDLQGGTVNSANPANYTVETADFTLTNPTRAGYTFAGWTLNSSTTAQMSVTIVKGYSGQRTYTATWAPIPAVAPTLSGSDPTSVTFGYTTGGTMTVGVSNSDTTAYGYSYAWYTGASATGDSLSTSESYTFPTGLGAGSHNYTVRVTAKRTDNGETAHADKTFTVTVNPAAHGTPSAPGLASKSYNSITVTAVNGQQYLCQLASAAAPTTASGDWQDGGEFTDLDPNKDYKIYTYKPAADNNHTASPVSDALDVTTDKVKITGVTAPGNTTLTDYCDTGDSAKAKLPASAACVSEDGGVTSLPITWTLPTTYDAAPSATNTFTWSVSAPADYEFANGATHSDSVTVTNKAATAVSITVTQDAAKLERTYAGTTFDVTDLFGFDGHEGTHKYSLTGGADSGSITETGILTVTKAGTFTIKVTTAPSGNYAAGEQTATLTVRKGSVTAPTITGKTYTGQLQTADVSGSAAENGYAVTKNDGGIDVGSYDVTLTLNKPDLYQWSDGTQTAAKTLSFAISQATNEWTATLACTGFTYDGTTTLAPTAQAKFGAVSFTYATVSGGPYEAIPAGGVKDAETYYIKASVEGNANYTGLTAGPVRVIIGKVKLTPSVASVTGRAYNGGTDAEGTISLAAAQGYAMPASETPSASGTLTWTAKNAGTTTVNVNGITLDSGWTTNYELAAASLSNVTAPEGAKISPKALTVTANDHTVTYGDALTGGGVNYDGFVAGEGSTDLGGTLDYAYSYEQYGNIGSDSYTLTPNGLTSTNYAITFQSGTLTVLPRPITVTIADKSSAYGAELQTLTATVTKGNIVNNDSVYSLNTDAASTSAVDGNYTITGTANNGNYAVTFAGSGGTAGKYDITNAALSGVSVTGYSGAYDGAAHNADASTAATAVNGQEITWKFGTVEGTYDQDHISIQNVADSKTYYYKVSAPNHADATGSFAVVISAKSISGATVTLGDALTYNGAEQTQSVTGVSIDGLAATFGVSDNQQTDAKRDYTLTVTGSGNFTGAQTATWGIAQKPLTVTARPQTITYGESIATGTAQVEVSGLAGGDTLDSVVLAPSGSAVAGDKTITPGAAVIKRGGTAVTGNYAITYKTGALTINNAAMTPAVSGYDKPYDGKAHGIAVIMDGAEIRYGTESGTYALTASPTYADVGAYTVYYQVTKTNYTTVTGSATVKITPKSIAAVWSGEGGSAADFSWVYDGKPHAPTATAVTGVDDETVTLSVSGAATEYQASAYTAAAAIYPANANYTLSNTTCNFSIAKADYDMSGVTFTDAFAAYDGAAHSLTVTGTLPTGADGKPVTVGYSGSATNVSEGAVNVTAVFSTQSANYNTPAAKTAKITVTPAPVSFAVSGSSCGYDALPHTAAVEQTAGETPSAAGKFTVSYQKDSETATASRTDVGAYKIIVTLNDANFKFKEQADAVRSLQVGTLTIGKSTVTVLWKNMTKVYTGEALSPDFELIGIMTGDEGKVYAELRETVSAAGTHAVTAVLKGDKAGDYSITNPAGTFIIQKAPVTFALSNNSVQHDGNPHAAAVTADIGAARFTVTYRDSRGNIAAAPTDAGSYDVYAEITDKNYRHAGAADGTARKIGVLTIYRASAPAAYTVSFAGDEGTTGSVPALPPALAGTPRVLPENPADGFAKAGNRFGGWQYGAKIYQPGETLTQPAADVTLRAVWIEKTYLIEGVVDDAGNPLADVVVTLMLGSRQIGQTKTDASGTYSFTNIAPGLYNLVASKDGVTQTTLVEIVAANETGKNITMPAQRTNSVVEVAAGSPAIVVGELEQTFSPEDVETAKTGSVEMKLTVEAVTESGDGAAIESKSSGTVGLLLDVTLTKTVITADGTTDSDASGELKESPVPLQIVISLPGELQRKDSYTVYRSHSGEVQALTGSPNAAGEYIAVNAERTAITVYAKYFSTYAVAFTTQSGGGSAAAYKPVLASAAHGSVTMRPAAPAAGATVTVTLTPEAGYEPASCQVTDSNGKAVALTKNSDGTYTFTQPVGAVTVTARFRAVWNPFTDVKQDDWFCDDVRYVYENGLMGGVSGTLFAPRRATNRGMIVAILWRMENQPTAERAMPFTDVAEGKYYHAAVAWAAENGIVGGYDTEHFGPERPITRAQLAAILYRYAAYKGYDVSAAADISKFADADKVGAWALSAMRWANAEGLITGKGGALDPQGRAERCQAAAILHRFCENIAK